jgi:uncharacterized membrane protein YfcA
MLEALTPDTLWILLACSVAFVLGGLVKGTLGVGLPLVAVPLLSLILGGHRAIALVVAPVIYSNVIQAFEGGLFKVSVKRFWPMMLAQTLFTVLTIKLTLDLSARDLNQMVAFSVLLALALMTFTPQFTISPRHEKWTSALVGGLSGLIGGVSSLTGPIIITYLMSLKLQREEFVGCISIIYLAAATPMYLAMYGYGRMENTDLLGSVIGLLPMALGLAAGKRLRTRLSEQAFRRVLYAFLLLLSILLVVR